MPLRTSLCWDSVGLKTRVYRSWVRCAVLPTKTSLSYIQFIRSSRSLLSACSQVFTTSSVNPLSCLIVVAYILSVESLSLILRSHHSLISLALCIFPCMVLSHLSVHMRWAASEISIWRRQVGPCFVLSVFCWLLLTGASFVSRCMLPHPMIVPMFISGHLMLSYGHVLLACFQIRCVGGALHSVKMWLVVSVTLQVVQLPRSS